MVLLDLCFYTDRVTENSHRATPGMPEGRGDDDQTPGYFDLRLLDAIHREFPDLPVFILSSKPREDVSLEFSRRGALGFIARDDLRAPQLFEGALLQHGLLPDPAAEVVGNSLPVLLALREARRAARHRANLLICGERGSGKELLALANYAHRVGKDASLREDCPFVAVNSAVLRTELFSSELFGIEPKTVSGVDAKIGLVEAAGGGDHLFLDEIADMPPEAQAIGVCLDSFRLTGHAGADTLRAERCCRLVRETGRVAEEPRMGTGSLYRPAATTRNMSEFVE